MRVAGEFSGKGGRVQPEFLAAWYHDFDIDDRDITAAFSGDPDIPFTIPGREIDDDGAVLGAGFVYANQSGWTAGIRLDAEFRSGDRAYGLTGEFRHRF